MYTNIVTRRSISRQCLKYVHATIEPASQDGVLYVVHIYPLLGNGPINTHA
jgi:hypothetical protein